MKLIANLLAFLVNKLSNLILMPPMIFLLKLILTLDCDFVGLFVTQHLVFASIDNQIGN